MRITLAMQTCHGLVTAIKTSCERHLNVSLPFYPARHQSVQGMPYRQEEPAHSGNAYLVMRISKNRRVLLAALLCAGLSACDSSPTASARTPTSPGTGLPTNPGGGTQPPTPGNPGNPGGGTTPPVTGNPTDPGPGTQVEMRCAPQFPAPGIVVTPLQNLAACATQAQVRA